MTKQAKASSSRPSRAAPPAYPAKQIAEDRRQIVARLHHSYLNLVNEMAPLQAEWDAGGQAAFARAATDGWQLGAEWRDRVADTFDVPFWTNIAPIDAAQAKAGAAGLADAPGALPGERLVRMRDQILALPSLLASGDDAEIGNKIGAVLRQFDAPYAEAVLGHEHFGPFLELIRHDESVLDYMAYVGLMITSVPPNFYAFVAGKGAPCLMLEAVVLAVTALVSGDNATAARIWEIEERVDDLESEETPASEALNIDEAVDALVRMLDDFRRAANDVHELCVNIGTANRTAVESVGMGIAEKMAAMVADTSCRDCGSSKHSTGLYRLGTVSYE